MENGRRRRRRERMFPALLQMINVVGEKLTKNKRQERHEDNAGALYQMPSELRRHEIRRRGWSPASMHVREKPLGPTSAWIWTTSDGIAERLDQDTVAWRAIGTRMCMCAISKKSRGRQRALEGGGWCLSMRGYSGQWIGGNLLNGVCQRR